jgi:hypothetical protein
MYWFLWTQNSLCGVEANEFLRSALVVGIDLLLLTIMSPIV